MKTITTKFGLVGGMIASVLLLGACSSFQQIRYDKSVGSDGFARPTGMLATEWGKLPTYSHQPTELRQLRSQFSRFPIWIAGIDNTATVDLLVNRDGTVRDVAIVESSGDPRKDSTIKPNLDGVRIETKIAPQDPAPYVFRTKVVFHKTPAGGPDYAAFAYSESRYTGMSFTTANDWTWGNR